ncbi:hypothetical protein OG533_31045 [Streptomyces sp. NBC_01186]|uniref:COG4315 family predicted lipoprotein n=1 Tax=Streptomyces sp. NBC_01186 TaxID=2903765 RepID=UPI002E14151A|nr:hypothetical protein OG533_31045 [Streptomyces sp. NBC_01186]
MGKFIRTAVPLVTAVVFTGITAGSSFATEAPTGTRVTTTPEKKASSAAKTVKVKKTKYGKILVNGKGRTLYLFKKDTSKKSTCLGSCAKEWPPMTADKPKAKKGAMKSLVSTSSRDKGQKQVTYHGHPLYRFHEDKKAGQINGEGLDQFGGKWYVVDPHGKAVLHKRSHKGKSSPSKSKGNGGY